MRRRCDEHAGRWPATAETRSPSIRHGTSCSASSVPATGHYSGASRPDAQGDLVRLRLQSLVSSSRLAAETAECT